MRVQVIQNISFEGPGYIEEIAEKKGYELFVTKLFDHEQPLPVTDYDMLVVLGGPMSIHEESEYPWISVEKRIIENAITSDKIVLGICLGAQMIADVLGAEVYKNEEREIGWYPVFRPNAGSANGPLPFLPDVATVFHWHNDTFDLPRNAVKIFSSEATENQSFLYENKVLAIQFHLETTKSIIKDLAYFCEEDLLVTGRFVMGKNELMDLYNQYEDSNRKMLRHIFKHFLD
jgi:GMP synthase (glutamine-hydrolysing)